MNNHTCCFIGHRRINDTPQLRERLQQLLLKLVKSGVTDYIFGDHSAFDTLCYEQVTELKKSYPEIKRINFRCNYEDADDYTMQFLVAGYEESVCPKGIEKAGRTRYIMRNQAMICKSDVCIFYYDEKYVPKPKKEGSGSFAKTNLKSGTAIAYKYALQKGKQIYNVK
ncbi:MAG: DUF1273 domain-containing protein [Clostridia bacterium]|nr:DUF1273 domain-containing protein [Clostridia bacterium]